MFAIISTEEKSKDKLLKKLKAAVKNKKKNFIKDISVKKVKKLGPASGKKIAVLDLGMTNGFLKQLQTLKCNVTLLPFDTDADKILKAKYKGLIISNGPENDKAIPQVVKTVQK